MGKRPLSTGRDYTEMLPIFRELVLKSGIEKEENLFFSGCQGTCYAMATFFSFGIRDLGLRLSFALDSDLDQLWRLEYVKNLGVIATGKENPARARVIVLMSGLTKIPFEKTLRFIENGLARDGTLIGETVVPGLFEQKEWDKQIPFKFLFEFSMGAPTSFEVVNTP